MRVLITAIKFLYHLVMCSLGLLFLFVFTLTWLQAEQGLSNNDPAGIQAILFSTVSCSVLFVFVKRLLIKKTRAF